MMPTPVTPDQLALQQIHAVCQTHAQTLAEALQDLHLRALTLDDYGHPSKDRHDLRGSDLSTLILTIFQNGGALSNNRRNRYADRVQAHVLHAVENAVSRAMLGQPLDDEDRN